MATNKSKPRKTRKKATPVKPAVDGWASLKELHAAAQGLVIEASKVSLIYRDGATIKTIPSHNIKEFNIQGEILLRDMKQLTQRLTAIKDKHINIDPIKDDVDCNMLAIMIGDEYSRWMADWTSVVPVTITKIFALLPDPSGSNKVAPAANLPTSGPTNSFGEAERPSGPRPLAQKQPSMKPSDLMAMAKGKKK